VNSEVELSRLVQPAAKFDFDVAETNLKWLIKEKFPFVSSDKRVGSFVYSRKRPFHPQRLHQLIEGNFLIDIFMPSEN